MAQSATGTALVRHAPTLNGRVEGSVQVMTAENITLGAGAAVTEKLLVPGMPSLVQNGVASFGGIQEGTGSVTPANHTVTLDAGSTLGRLVRRTDAVTLPVVSSPPLPQGTRSVTLTAAGQSPGDFATLKNLTLNSNVGQVAVPPGTYGVFKADSGSGFTLGVAGATMPATYDFQHLSLYGGGTLDVVGPVIITLEGPVPAIAAITNFYATVNLGNPTYPGWLKFRLHGGVFGVANNKTVYAHVEAPDGIVMLGSGSQFTGSLLADRLIIGSNALLRLVEPVAALPFVAGFETGEGYTLGPVHGQKGWTATSPAVVTDADFASGVRSVLVPGGEPPLSLSQAFGDHPDHGVVFVDMFVLPQAAASEAAAAKLSLLNAAEVAFVRDGTAGRFFVRSGDGTGGGAWQPSPATVPVDAQGFAADWVRITLRLDYTAKEWDLYVGGVMAAAKVGFGQATQAGLGSFTLTGQTAAPTLLDDFLAGFDSPLFADTDRDGMADVWETAHGLNPALNDRNGDPDQDGLVNIIEYLIGASPNDTDTDDDGLPDAQEHTLGTNPALVDTDGDELSDGWEISHGFDPSSPADAGLDADGDGNSNLLEFQQGTDPADYYNGTLPDLVSQIPASGELGTGDTLRVLVKDDAGAPLANAPVKFTAKAGGHLLAAASAGPVSTSVTVRTGSDGVATVYVKAGDVTE